MPRTATRPSAAKKATAKKTAAKRTAASHSKPADQPPPPATPDLGLWPIHPAADRLPFVSQVELDELADDIRKNGQIEPITTYQGMILDGRNRLAACRLAGVEPRMQEWQPTGEAETPLSYVVSRNLRRRQLSPGQKAAIAVQLAQDIAEQQRQARAAERLKTAEENQATLFSAAEQAKAEAARAKGGTEVRFTGTAKEAAATPQRQRPDSPFQVPAAAAPRGRARDLAARQLGVSAGYVNDAAGLLKADPQAYEAVLRGEKSIPQAQREVVEKAEREGNLDTLALREGIKRLAQGPGRKAAAGRPKISLRKFGKLESSRTTVRMDLTFGNPNIAEEWLNKLNDDPRVLALDFELVEGKKAKGAAKKAARARR